MARGIDQGENMNRIVKNMVVTINYKITDPDGNMIDDGHEPIVYMHGGYNNIFIPIENVLEGKSIGDTVTVKLQPGEAFGEYEPELVQIVPVEELPQPVKIGMMIEGTPEGDSDNEPIFCTITDIADGKAVLDCNHPLAGMALIFIGTVATIIQARDEEIAARHPL
jgi:FKBP-type peptidyl-prolyl cis-trans isomerase SlyD